MAHDRHHSARARMDERYRQLLALCAKAYGVGAYAGFGPDAEAARQLEELLDTSPSEQELADLQVVGWSPSWRRDFRNSILLAREMAGDDIEVSEGSGLTPVNTNVTPRTLH